MKTNKRNILSYDRHSQRTVQGTSNTIFDFKVYTRPQKVNKSEQNKNIYTN